jgi:glycosyltransferase involved in cell wall biosynthesis
MQPQVTIIVATNNNAKGVAQTCESLLSLKGCHWEAIFIDGGSTDRTLEVIQSFEEKRFRVQTLSGVTLFALINRGILMAQTPYVQIILPGCCFLAPTSLSSAFAEIEKCQFPDLFITASYVGDSSGVMHLYYEPFTQEMLLQGLQPALLQSCFIKRDLFKKLGYFSTNLGIRSTFDFFCRVKMLPDLHIFQEERVFIELDRLPQGVITLLPLVYETLQVLCTHFGLRKTLHWLLALRHNCHKKLYRSLWQ